MYLSPHITSAFKSELANVAHCGYPGIIHRCLCILTIEFTEIAGFRLFVAVICLNIDLSCHIFAAHTDARSFYVCSVRVQYRLKSSERICTLNSVILHKHNSVVICIIMFTDSVRYLWINRSFVHCNTSHDQYAMKYFQIGYFLRRICAKPHLSQYTVHSDVQWVLRCFSHSIVSFFFF